MSDKALVLIVDDSPTNLQLLASCVKDDHRVKVATNGEQCIEIAKTNPKPDLILLDVEMPGMSGYQVCQQLKSCEMTSEIPIIFVTGLLGDKDEEKGLALGAVDYITKPIRPAIVIARVKTHITLKFQRDKLNRMAFFDQLTGLHNRHYLIDTASKKVARALRHKYDLWVLMIDIDHFKVINDTYGHPMGDEVLKDVAATLLLDNRSEDIAARLGGEEFVVMFDPCDKTDAMLKARRILDKIATLNPHDIRVTVSIGIAKLMPEDRDFEYLLKRADDALYQAKENGRNRIEIAS